MPSRRSETGNCQNLPAPIIGLQSIDIMEWEMKQRSPYKWTQHTRAQWEPPPELIFGEKRVVISDSMISVKGMN